MAWPLACVTDWDITMPYLTGQATLTDTGYDKVVAGAPRHLQAVRDYLINILSPGELRSLAAIGDRADDPASFAFRRARATPVWVAEDFPAATVEAKILLKQHYKEVIQ